MNRLLLTVVLFSATDARAQDDPRSLVGLWGGGWARSTPAHTVRLTRTASGWQIRLDGVERRVESGDTAVVVPMIDSSSAIRLTPRKRGTPMVHLLSMSSGGTRFASPQAVVRRANGVFEVALRPPDDRVTLYLHITRRSDGSLEGRFRNPEFGWNLGRTYTVSRVGAELQFTDPGTTRVRLRQPFDSAAGTITFDFGTPFVLRRQSAGAAAGFFAVPGGHAWSYAPPLRRDDGWAVARARAEGFDETVLSRVVGDFVSGDPAGESTPLLHSLLVARRGRLVLDAYFRGFDADRPHDTRSAFKTAISVMAGTAMHRGADLSPSTSIATLLRSHDLPPDDARSRIQLAHLLTHTSGLACDDNDPQSPGNEERLQRQRGEWTKFMLALGVLHDPGAHYAYCSGTMHLAGELVAAASGEWLPAFFEETIARPLQFGAWAFNLTPDGQGYGGGGTHLRPRDLLKLGQLYLNDGVWNGRRLVKREWVRASVAHQVVTPDGGSDGYGWHRYRVSVGSRTWEEYEANGNGGQMVMVVPELQLVVGVTAGNYNRYRVWRRFREELLPAIIASLSGPTGR